MFAPDARSHMVFICFSPATFGNRGTYPYTSSAGGRPDLVIEEEMNTWIFEFKVKVSAEAAIRRIRDLEYHQLFWQERRRVHLVGVMFSSRTRYIAEYIHEDGRRESGCLKSDTRSGCLKSDSRSGCYKSDTRCGCLKSDARCGCLENDTRSGCQKYHMIILS